MKIAVMARSYNAALIHPHILATHPGADVAYVGGGVVNTLSFRLPRGLPLSSYPWTGEPVWRRNDAYSTVFRMETGEDAQRTLRRVDTDLSPIDTFAAADLHVLADDTAMGQFANFVDLMAYSGRRNAVQDALWSDIAFRHGETLTGSDALRPFDAASMANAAGGRAKRRFDYAWAVNSVAVLGRTMRTASGRSHAVPPSKYGMQLLYGMRDVPPIRLGSLLQMMREWKGTGRYTEATTLQDGMGNGASRCQIVSNLSDSGFITPVSFDGNVDSRLEVGLTEVGQAFLESLHPDCRDVDLPFRIVEWMRKGEGAYGSIDRYIRTYFGKQMRYTARRRTP